MTTKDTNCTSFADRAWFGRAAILANDRIAEATYKVRLGCPTIAERILPGQFVMLRLAGGDDPLLGRPLALYDTVLSSDGRPVAIDVVYLIVGKLTSRLARLRPGDEVELWGPLGNGFPPLAAEHLVIVAGGIGQTPFLAVCREAIGERSYGSPARRHPGVRRASFCYGARSAAYLAGVEDFRTLGVEIALSTDDGSAGRRGFVTSLMDDRLGDAGPGTLVLCCGPEPMMAAAARIARARGVPCLISLETPMACGLGICFSCVARVRDSAGGWDYRRTCVEGPVFDGAAIEW